MINKMEWYLTLSIHERINAKSVFVLLIGVEFGQLSFLLSFREQMDVMYDKLKIEGLIE